MRSQCDDTKIGRHMNLLHGRGRSSFTMRGGTSFTPGSEAASLKGPFLSSILKYQRRYSAACTASLAGARSKARRRGDRKGRLRGEEKGMRKEFRSRRVLKHSTIKPHRTTVARIRPPGHHAT